MKYRYIADGQIGTVEWLDANYGVFTSDNGAVFTVLRREVVEVQS